MGPLLLSSASIPSDGEGPKPRSYRWWLHVTGGVRERWSPAICLSNGTFDSVPISMAPHLNSETGALQCGVEMVGFVDGERGLLDLLPVAELTERQYGELRGPALERPDVTIFAGSGSAVAYSHCRSSSVRIPVSSSEIRFVAPSLLGCWSAFYSQL